MTDFDFRASGDGIEVRAAAGKLTLLGMAIRYGARSRDLGGFRERIMPGAATEAIQKGDVLALHEHDVRNLLGRLSSGTLRLDDSATELRYEVDLPDTTVGREVAMLVERGDVKGSSFGFRAAPAKVKWSVEDGMALRSVHGIRFLRDVSTTAIPAYEQTNGLLTLRSFAAEAGLDVEYRAVVDAANNGTLAALLDSAHEDPPGEDDDPAADEQTEQEGEPAPLVRRPLLL